MTHVHCPKCGRRLELPPIQETRGVRCPACKHEFVVSPPSQPQPLPGDYTGEGTGVFAKTSLAVLAALGIALIAILIYKTAAGPGSTEEPPQPAPIVARDTDPKPQSPEQIFAKASPAVVYITVRDKNFKPIGLGSGFFIDSEGLIVTNHHVMKRAEFATALLSSGSTLFVDGVTAVDKDADLAVLKVSGKEFPCLKEADDALPKVGSTVYAIGNPRGLENTFSSGIVSGHRVFKEGAKVIQTTAPISPGSSGGPLLNGQGEVVGITTSYLVGSQNLNFAVSIASLRRLVKEQGKSKILASTGGGQFDNTETEELDKAWAAMDEKDWSTASKVLLALRKTQRNNPFVWCALGYLHSRLGNYEIAIQHCKAAIVLKPDYAKAYQRMGYIYDDLGRYADAIAAYKKAIAIKRDYADAYCNMGVVYSNLGQHADAIAAYKKAIIIEPDCAKAYNNIGATYGNLGRHVDAIAASRKAIAIKPDYAESYNTIANAYYDLGRYPDAIATHKKAIAIKPDYAEAYNNIGFAYRKLGQHADEIAAYKKAIAIKPDYAKAYNNIGFAYHTLGKHIAALAACKKAIAIKPDYAEAYLGMGATYFELGRYAEVIVACKKAIAIKADYPEAYNNMGNAYGNLKRYALAITAFKKAIALKPDKGDTYSNMGTVYNNSGRYTDAIAAFKKAIVLKPDCAVAYSNLGDTYNTLGKYVDGLAACEKAIAIKSDYAEPHYSMGVAYDKLKQDSLAITAFEKAIALKPKAKWSNLARLAIRRLRKQ